MSPVTLGNLVHRGAPATPARVCSISEILADTGSVLENPRILARRQALESPTAPRSTAIPPTEIASYPQEWHDGACSGKYSYIPSYMGWHRGEQPELARPSIPAERPPSPVPGPSAWTDLPEQPVFEGPQRSSRVQQQRQRPDNVYGDDPFVDHLTESQWDTIIAGGNNNSWGNSLP